MKIGIIGSGISGISAAKMLHAKHETILFEKAPKRGGLLKCERVNDCLFHTVGGHVFNSKNQQVLNWFWSHFDRDTEFVKARRNARILLNNSTIGYPIENYIYLLDKLSRNKVIDELLALQATHHQTNIPCDNFGDFLRSHFGETLYQLYFEPYNKKIWQTDLNSIPLEWLEGKLPMPDLKAIIQHNMLREEESEMVHSTFYYAKEGGSQFILDRLSQGLTIQEGSHITSIEKSNQHFSLNEFTGFDKVIYCGDIRNLPPFIKKKLKDQQIDISYIESLRTTGTSTLFCESDETDISWLYIPEAFTKAHRIIYTGNFSSSNNRGSKRKTCVVEFSGKVDYQTMKEEIKKLPGNLLPLAYNYQPDSYIIQDKNTRSVINRVKTILSSEGFYLLGRFAEWEYYNMDKCMEAALELTTLIEADA